MAIAVECPTCKAVAQVPDEAAGARGRCRRCGGIVQVPRSEERVHVVSRGEAYPQEHPIGRIANRLPPSSAAHAEGKNSHSNGGRDRLTHSAFLVSMIAGFWIAYRLLDTWAMAMDKIPTWLEFIVFIGMVVTGILISAFATLLSLRIVLSTRGDSQQRVGAFGCASVLIALAASTLAGRHFYTASGLGWGITFGALTWLVTMTVLLLFGAWSALALRSLSQYLPNRRARRTTESATRAAGHSSDPVQVRWSQSLRVLSIILCVGLLLAVPLAFWHWRSARDGIAHEQLVAIATTIRDLSARGATEQAARKHDEMVAFAGSRYASEASAPVTGSSHDVETPPVSQAPAVVRPSRNWFASLPPDIKILLGYIAAILIAKLFAPGGLESSALALFFVFFTCAIAWVLYILVAAMGGQFPMPVVRVLGLVLLIGAFRSILFLPLKWKQLSMCAEPFGMLGKFAGYGLIALMVLDMLTTIWYVNSHQITFFVGFFD